MNISWKEVTSVPTKDAETELLRKNVSPGDVLEALRRLEMSPRQTTLVFWPNKQTDSRRPGEFTAYEWDSAASGW